jgi:hypothetical protein
MRFPRGSYREAEIQVISDFIGERGGTRTFDPMTSAEQEACVASAKELKPMDAQLVEATIKLYLTEIRNRLDKAAGIGRAADACAGAGFHEKGLEVALDTEQLLYEAATLLNAANLINRIARQS